jgi:carboxyl-terminal processing protease
MDIQNMENMEPNLENNEPKKKSGFGKGVAVGVAVTLLLEVAVWCICHFGAGLNLYVERATISLGSVSAVLDSDAVSKINELTAYIGTYYYEDVTVEDLQEGMYAGLLEGLNDKYSVYYDADAYQQTQINTTGQYCGIGAGLAQDQDTMIVSITKIYEGTPSEEAGLREDDIILSVDGTEADSMEVSELVKLIRGEEGTTVHLEIYRPSSDEYLSVDVVRANVTLPSVSYEMLEDGIGYIYIDSFEKDTAAQFENAVAALEEQGMQAMIVDLRNNGGGLVDSVVQILDDILPEGLLVYTEDKNGNRQEYYSDGKSSIDYPMAVLVNENSASASEIFAGAIKDYGYGTLIGTTTFGKGIVQTIFPLSDNDAVKLTTAKYFTPNGNYIHGVGIDPDIELEYEYLDPDGETYEKQYDNQIQKAIEILDGEME